MQQRCNSKPPPCTCDFCSRPVIKGAFSIVQRPPGHSSTETRLNEFDRIRTIYKVCSTSVFFSDVLHYFVHFLSEKSNTFMNIIYFHLHLKQGKSFYFCDIVLDDEYTTQGGSGRKCAHSHRDDEVGGSGVSLLQYWHSFIRLQNV